MGIAGASGKHTAGWILRACRTADVGALGAAVATRNIDKTGELHHRRGRGTLAECLPGSLSPFGERHAPNARAERTFTAAAAGRRHCEKCDFDIRTPYQCG